MNNSLASVLLLLLAIALLWAAVTNRLGRWLDGLDVALGTKTISTASSSADATVPDTLAFFSLPGLNPMATHGGVTPAGLGPSSMTTALTV